MTTSDDITNADIDAAYRVLRAYNDVLEPYAASVLPMARALAPVLREMRAEVDRLKSSMLQLAEEHAVIQKRTREELATAHERLRIYACGATPATEADAEGVA